MQAFKTGKRDRVTLSADLIQEVTAKITHDLINKTFADPTYDSTFKMLFNETNPDLTLSLINNLMDLDKIIEEVKFLPGEFPAGIHKKKIIVDVRCKASDGQQFVIEMQRQHKKYFMARMQYYMAGSILLQMESGEPDYNKALKKSYILVISRENLYTNQDNANNFEKTITPTVREEEHIDMNPNFMHWKLYEVNKFSKMLEDNSPSNLKGEWLQFFVKCSSMKEVPVESSAIIQKAYKIMIKNHLTDDKLDEYKNENFKEAWDRGVLEEEIEQIEKQLEKKIKAEAEAEVEIAKAEAEAAKAEADAAKAEAMLKVKQIKIEGLKKTIDSGVDHSFLLKIFDDFNEEQISAVENHVHQHPDCSTEELMSLLAEVPIQALEHAA